MTETFDLGLEQARAYEDLFVPALFAQWVPTLLRQAGVAPGQHVLDVACGTGVAARAAEEVVGATGGVSGVDRSAAMLHVARECAPRIDWRVGDAADLPYDDESFDAALCQSALFFFPAPERAVSEMARVLRVGGTVAVQTYAGLEDQPGYGPFVEVVARHSGPDARRLLGTYWSWGGLAQLRGLLTAAGLDPGTGLSVLGTMSFPSVEALVHTEIHATPLAERLDDSAYQAIVRDAGTALARFSAGDGSLSLPVRARFVAARKPAASVASPDPDGHGLGRSGG